MKKTEQNSYPVPTLDVQELEVERGFLLSSNYGEVGEAGQGSDYIDSDVEL